MIVRKGWRLKEAKDSEERIARKGWQGKETKDSKEMKERIVKNDNEERMARKGRTSL